MNAKMNTRQQIVDTAAILFHAHNYSDIGVARVCEEAGVSKGSFFHFFPTKRDLALAVVEQVNLNMAAGVIRDAFDPSIPPMERFHRFVDGFYQQSQTEKATYGNVLGCPFGNLILEQGARDEALRVKANGVMKSMALQLQAALADAVQASDLPASLDEEATAVAMLGYLEGLLLLAKSRNDPEIISRLGPAITSIQIHKDE